MWSFAVEASRLSVRCAFCNAFLLTTVGKSLSSELLQPFCRLEQRLAVLL